MLLGVFEWSIATLLPFLLIFMILALALNIQFGGGGVINFGVVAFFMVGAYASALLTLEAPPMEDPDYILGWSLPLPVGWLGGMLAAVVLALIVAVPVVRLREDFLAITTIGVAHILRTVFNTTEGLAGSSVGLRGIPRPFGDLIDDPDVYRWVILGVLVGIMLLVALVSYMVMASPWGRSLRALRDNERTTRASGKQVTLIKLQAFVLGAAFMGLAGAVYGHYLRSVASSSFTDLFGTFLVWTMLIVGGSGRMMGAVVGTLVVGTLWFGASLVQSFLPQVDSQYIFAFRQLLIGLLIVLFVMYRPQGLLPERADVSRFLRPPRNWADLSRLRQLRLPRRITRRGSAGKP